MDNFLTIEERNSSIRRTMNHYPYDTSVALSVVSKIVETIDDFEPYILAEPILNPNDPLANQDVRVIEPGDPSTVIYCPMIYDYEQRQTPLITREKFAPAIDELAKLPGVVRAFIMFVPGGSYTSLHVDNDDKELYTPSQLYNVILSIKVPSSDRDILGVKIHNDIVDVVNPIIFDSQIPHQGWNKTDNMWLSLLLLIDKDYFDDRRS